LSELGRNDAASIADSRGLRVHESHKAKASAGGAGSVLSLLLKSSTEEHTVKGAVLHGNAPRLLHVDGIDVEAPLERNLIYMRNSDVPGVIGKVGTLFGAANVNIANMTVSRTRQGGQALMALSIDSPAPADLVQQIHSEFDDARFISLE